MTTGYVNKMPQGASPATFRGAGYSAAPTTTTTEELSADPRLAFLEKPFEYETFVQPLKATIGS